MYDMGQGVLRNRVEAEKWYRKAAERGFASAQTALGMMYMTGFVAPDFRLPLNWVLAHMWFILAASQGDVGAAEFRDLMEDDMTREQIAEAEKLAREWRPK
jgi:hypothetical protein